MKTNCRASLKGIPGRRRSRLRPKMSRTRTKMPRPPLHHLLVQRLRLLIVVSLDHHRHHSIEANADPYPRSTGTTLHDMGGEAEMVATEEIDLLPWIAAEADRVQDLQV